MQVQFVTPHIYAADLPVFEEAFHRSVYRWAGNIQRFANILD